MESPDNNEKNHKNQVMVETTKTRIKKDVRKIEEDDKRKQTFIYFILRHI
jgi:hypothetical protein